MHPRRVAERRVHLAQRPDHEQVDVGGVEDRQHPDHARHAVDVQPLQRPSQMGARQRGQQPAMRRQQIDPGDRAHIGGEEERHQIGRLQPAPPRHVGARHQESQGKAQQQAEDRGGDTGDQGVQRGTDEARIGEQGDEIARRQGRAVAGPDQQTAQHGGRERPGDQRHADEDTRRGQPDLCPSPLTATHCLANSLYAGSVDAGALARPCLL